ncbi:helix-turn-helix domain-containing protein [Arabiibacter massiliensis]|uniref:helix-turn-helix domain-containing protein n=1 Tax=Arabiibacter massiliensis TaxID=1870985 RepID=UPI00155A1460|nr:helix-turn-helix domain-containing protein [Arabiibacter massiliensis]
MEDATYLSTKEAARKWGMTARRVQQLCREGQVPTARREGRSWLIPADAERPEASEGAEALRPLVEAEPFMPLTASAFPLGRCEEFIARLPEASQPLAWAEFYYFSGRAEEAAEAAEPYLRRGGLKKRLTAAIVYGFANLSLGRINSARFAFEGIRETLEPLKSREMEGSTKAACVFAAAMASVLLHLPYQDIPPLRDSLRCLPDGLKQYACYILAHQAYLEKDYERALGSVETALAWCDRLYPIPAVYLHVMAAVCAMNAKRTEEAREHFWRAWGIAGPDDLIEAFGEHHGLLQGLIEAELRTRSPEDYERVIAITYRFSSGWRKVHNPDTGHPVADDLTTTEFTAAMLADRGWSYQQIADHMGLSSNTVGKYLSSVYRKLGIKTKEELHAYMLW